MCSSLKKIIEFDENDIKKTDTEHDQYLQITIENYVSCMIKESNDELDMSWIFRLFGLWISNQSADWISPLIDKCLKKIPSFKFVPLMPQMTAHIGSSNLKLSTTIGKIVRK